jgi:uncharacterized ion transporter superfamily protein YfcC
LKSAKLTRHFSKDKLSNITQRQKNTIGLIKVNNTSKEFRTRLKSEHYSDREDKGLGDGHKGYINLLCLHVKKNMAKLLCHCVILLLLCLCGVVMVHHNIGETKNTLIHNVGGYKHKQNSYITTPESSILLVSIVYFISNKC